MKTIIITAGLLLTGVAGALAQDVCAPDKVSTLHMDQQGYFSYTMKWTATGDDASTGNANTYEIRSSTSNITDTNWQGANVYASGTAPTNGTESCFLVTASCPGGGKYWVVFLIDEAGNRSPLGNVVAGSGRCHQPFTDIDDCP